MAKQNHETLKDKQVIESKDVDSLEDFLGAKDPLLQTQVIDTNAVREAASIDIHTADETPAKVEDAPVVDEPVVSRAHVIIERVKGENAPILTGISYNDSTTDTANLEQAFFDPNKDSFAVNADVAAAATACLHCGQSRAAHLNTAQICELCNQGIGAHRGLIFCRTGERAQFETKEFDSLRCADSSVPVFAFTVNSESRVKLLSDVEAQRLHKELMKRVAQES